MSHANKKKPSSPSLIPKLMTRLREGLMIILLAIACFFMLALTSYNASDTGWSQAGSTTVILNSAGKVGAWFADFFLYFFGLMAYFIPAVAVFSAVNVIRQSDEESLFDRYYFSIRVFGFIITLVSATALLTMHFQQYALSYPLGSGGALGKVISDLLVAQFNIQGSTLLLLSLLLVGITLTTGLSWLKVLDACGHELIYFSQLFAKYSWINLNKFIKYSQQIKENLKTILKNRRERKQIVASEKSNPFQPPISSEKPVKKKKNINIHSPKILEVSKRAEKAQQLTLFKEKKQKGGLPSFQLLQQTEHGKSSQIDKQALEHMSRLVEEKLADFGVNVNVVAVHPGPVITRFELQLAPGIKVSKITGLAKDLARSLSIVSVRVVEIIPGKPVVGLELPNVDREIVRLREVVGSTEYEKMSSPLSMALGKDIAGKAIVVDLAKMPHLLVAGTTGSGKSVGVNGMILSILFKAQPEDVRLIMIDPKMLELSIYEGIPHLLSPVVTDMKEAANALKWCVAEMERRYQLMAALGVRNLSGYNRKIQEAIKANKPIFDPTFEPQDGETAKELVKLPFIVVVIDEFADMMMVVGKKVEELIARIAQKARAAGIHLILATQRPSVDVITGLIKANVPTRIAFQVASRIDSRTILDQQGAEQLLGKGDMLYLPAGAGLPIRVHGAFVDDQEVHDVVNDWRLRDSPDYLEEILQGTHHAQNNIDKGLLINDSDDEELDSLYDEAVKIVTESKRASISLVQRRLKIGYNRAARIMEQMEGQGVVGPMQSSGGREVLAPPPVEI